MRLENARLHQIGPLSSFELDLSASHSPRPRSLAVLHGAGGTGKSLILAAISVTRPGNLQRCPGPAGESSSAAVCTWRLDQEEPHRPHGVCVTSPGFGLSDELAGEPLRRREQTHYDRHAAHGGFAFIGIPATRRFSSNPIMLSDTARSLGTYDPRGGPGFCDTLRAELTRSVKQVLTYAASGAALCQRGFSGLSADGLAFDRLDEALRQAVSVVCGPIGVVYRGIDPLSLEPMFSAPGQRLCKFDALSQQARHLLALSILPVHHFWLASHGQDPREVEGVVAVDDLEHSLSDATQERVIADLQTLLPQAQWIVATSSYRIAASVEKDEVIALRHVVSGEEDAIACYQGALGLTH